MSQIYVEICNQEELDIVRRKLGSRHNITYNKIISLLGDTEHTFYESSQGWEHDISWLRHNGDTIMTFEEFTESKSVQGTVEIPLRPNTNTASYITMDSTDTNYITKFEVVGDAGGFNLDSIIPGKKPTDFSSRLHCDDDLFVFTNTVNGETTEHRFEDGSFWTLLELVDIYRLRFDEDSQVKTYKGVKDD